jgi:hypothetical protein
MEQAVLFQAVSRGYKEVEQCYHLPCLGPERERWLGAWDVWRGRDVWRVCMAVRREWCVGDGWVRGNSKQVCGCVAARVSDGLGV